VFFFKLKPSLRIIGKSGNPDYLNDRTKISNKCLCNLLHQCVLKKFDGLAWLGYFCTFGGYPSPQTQIELLIDVLKLCCNTDSFSYKKGINKHKPKGQAKAEEDNPMFSKREDYLHFLEM
jgi:hypothetical protein